MQPTTVVKREPSPVKGGTTWTGFGFMQVYEGSDLTFEVPAIFREQDYDLVVRHEHLPTFPDAWDKAKAELVYLDGPPAGKCAAASGKVTNDNPGPELTASSIVLPVFNARKPTTLNTTKPHNKLV